MKHITFFILLCFSGLGQTVPLNLQHNVDTPCNNGLLDCAVACVVDGYVGGVCLEKTNKCRCDVPVGRKDDPFYQQNDATKKVIVVPAGRSGTQGQSAQQQSSTGVTSGKN